MPISDRHRLNVAIACGGTGGHLFPGMAVAEQLVCRDAAVTLMVSEKEIDQLAVRTAPELRVVTLPAVGLIKGRIGGFVKGFVQSYRAAARLFRKEPPNAVLAMGGFTSAPPVVAGRRGGAATFLHESNTIPGRANRWLSRVVNEAFVGFPEAANRLHARESSVTGTPVRGKFQGLNTEACQIALGLDPKRPVVLIMGGSQGAHGINELVSRSLPLLALRGAGWQWLHLAGAADAPALEQGYRDAGLTSKVYPFFAQMELVMGAASSAVSRAGASSLAELAATRLPSLLVPFPAATENHQFWNARAFEQSGAAKMLQQSEARPEQFVGLLSELMENEELRRNMQSSLTAWHKPHAAEQIAESMLNFLRTPRPATRNAARGTGADDSRADSTGRRAQTLCFAAKQPLPGRERATLV